MPTGIPWWYQPTGSGEIDSIDRRVESGYPSIPPLIEVRDGGVFWSFDPEHQIPRVNPLADNTSQLLGHLRAALAALHQRSSKRPMLESDRVNLIQQVKDLASFLAPDRRTLTDFLKLERARPEDVLKYANKHGVLDLCEHMFPYGNHLSCQPMGWPLDGWTSLETWRRTAGIFAAILRISSDLRENAQSTGRNKDWQVLFSAVQSNNEMRSSVMTNREHGLNMLQLVVNSYLQLGEVTPLLARTSPGWKLHFAGNSLYPLFGNLAFQLALILCGADVIYTCAGCGTIYVREGDRRRPKSGTRNYCNDCGKPKAALDAKRNYLARIAEARKLRADGLTTVQIAIQMRIDKKKVARWVALNKSGAG